MTQVYCIEKILGIKDPNIHLEEIPVEFETIKQYVKINRLKKQKSRLILEVTDFGKIS